MPDENSYTYTTAELAKFYGLSRKGLAFYEEKGILHPGRQENNKYRVFSLTDCYNLCLTKIYENCGFSLSETADLLKGSSPEKTVDTIERQLDALETEIRLRERVLRLERRNCALIRRALEAPFFEIVQSPAFYRLFVRTWEEHIVSPEASLEFEAWNRTKPINTASLRYDAARILSGDEHIGVNIGDIMNVRDFEEMGFTLSERIALLPPRRCLHTVLIGDACQIEQRAWLNPALRYLSEHGLVLAGDPFTAMLLVVDRSDGKLRMDEAWLPIEGETV